ncbi:AbrB family transcriptional regulator [Paenibacillus chartarius]|uniref:AbrB family transcriptional regulator n=1 Tax=Paenibacillus chartarius TaxID=747481 RepID=A0ABV6DTN0_9BACL
MIRPSLTTLLIALAGAALFNLLHIPIPWLLGPMIAVLIANNSSKLRLAWPRYVRDIGLVLTGYSMGLSLTRDALVEIGRQLPSMLLMTVTLVVMCAGTAVIISRLTGINFPTLMTGSIPGGLTQMITLAEEFPRIDVTIVTLFQVVRLMMIVIVVPLLLFSPLLGGEHVGGAAAAGSAAAEWPALLSGLPILLPVCVLGVILGKACKLPTAHMLGPMLAAAAAALCGFHGPELPSPLLAFSQLVIGCYVGLLLQPGKLPHKARTITLALAGGSVLIAVSLVLTWLHSRLHNAAAITSFLSLSPGGMDQMGLMAHETGADLSIVTSYQTFRLLFIYFAVPPMLKWLFQRMEKREASAGSD